MKYTFKRHDPIPGSIVFVLILDMKRKKERILIGNENYVELRLRGSEEDNIFYDRTAPLGSLLMNFHQDLGRAWNEYGFMPFWNALHSNRWKQTELEKMGFDFLRSRFENGYPLDIYAALRISEGYLKARLLRDRNRAADIFNIEMAEIKDGLMDWTDERIKTPKKFYEDSSLSKKAIKIDLWYPTGTPEPECVIAHDSILPVINFYHSRLLSAGLNIRKCKVCGKYFLAESLKYELCSKKCRKEQGKIKKREFDARAVENSYDRTYKNECQRWRNIIHRAEKSEDTFPEQLSKMKAAFEDFKAEALKRKTAVKKGQSSPKEFEDWIIIQSSVLYDL